MSCHGDPIEFEDLRTPGQIKTMTKLGDYLTPDIGKTREPYPGTLSAPNDPGQLAAMNTMMGMGGYGNYNAPQMQLGPGARVGPVGPAGNVSGPAAGDASANPFPAAPHVYAEPRIGPLPTLLPVPSPRPVGPIGPSIHPGDVQVDPSSVGPAGPLGPTWAGEVRVRRWTPVRVRDRNS